MPATANKRRFEFSEGSSNKFWEITVTGADVTVHFGRIGSYGQGESKAFADCASAQEHAESKIREKISKGYVEVG